MSTVPVDSEGAESRVPGAGNRHHERAQEGWYLFGDSSHGNPPSAPPTPAERNETSYKGEKHYSI